MESHRQRLSWALSAIVKAAHHGQQKIEGERERVLGIRRGRQLAKRAMLWWVKEKNERAASSESGRRSRRMALLAQPSTPFSE